MEEIGVVVQQEIGTITWNYEEIKQRLSAELEIYKKTVYTDDTIKSAKTDLANLRKLPKEIDSRRKEIKAKCLEPYDPIERQAKELVGMVNETVEAINVQVEDYEKRRKEAIRAKIEDYWGKQSEKLPEDLRQKAHDKLYDSRWENATCTMKTWKEGIDGGIDQILRDIETLQSFHSEYEEDMMKVYKVDLNLQPAIQKMNQMNAQRDRILEQERKKKEEEERRAREEAERKAEEERAKAEEKPVEPPNVALKEEPKEVTPPATETPQKPVEKVEKEVITIIGTRDQINKVKSFIKWSKADYREGAV